MADFDLTVEQELSPEQQAEAEQIADVVLAAMRVEASRIGRLLASKGNSELFGQTEFQLREIVLGLAARALDAALSERKKGGTEDAASAARAARAMRGSSATARRR